MLRNFLFRRDDCCDDLGEIEGIINKKSKVVCEVEGIMLERVFN